MNKTPHIHDRALNDRFIELVGTQGTAVQKLHAFIGDEAAVNYRIDPVAIDETMKTLIADAEKEQAAGLYGPALKSFVYETILISGLRYAAQRLEGPEDKDLRDRQRKNILRALRRLLEHMPGDVTLSKNPLTVALRIDHHEAAAPPVPGEADKWALTLLWLAKRLPEAVMREPDTNAWLEKFLLNMNEKAPEIARRPNAKRKPGEVPERLKLTLELTGKYFPEHVRKSGGMVASPSLVPYRPLRRLRRATRQLLRRATDLMAS